MQQNEQSNKTFVDKEKNVLKDILFYLQNNM